MSPERWRWQQLDTQQGAVFHLPVGDAWWWHSPEQYAVLDGTTLLHRRGRELALHRNIQADDVVTSTSGIARRRPSSITRQQHRWSHPTHPLALGASHARRFWSSPCGNTWLWEDDFWLYRQRRDQAPQPLGRVHAHDELLVGPQGAVLLLREGVYAACASPTGPLLGLAVSAEAHWWGVRWADNGRTAALPGPQGGVVSLHTATVNHGPCWPANSSGSAALNEQHTALSAPSATTPLPTCSAARLGSLLAGPGGVSWDLHSGQQLFTKPVWRLGATVAVSEQRFLTVCYESGAADWIEPRTGERLHSLTVPLEQDELVEHGWAEAGVAVLLLSSGRMLEVGQEHAQEVEHAQPQPAKRPRLRLALPYDDAATIGAHTWAWTESGLLVAVPSQA